MNVSAIPVISIALSIVVCWALFAITCSLIYESIVQVKSECGRFMKQYLLKQFRDDANKINWANLMYHQGTINLLSRDIRKPSDNIDPALFARAIVSAVSGSHLVRTKVQELQKLAESDESDQYVKSGNLHEQNLVAGKAFQDLSVYSHAQVYYFNAAISILQKSEQVTLFENCFSNAELERKIIIGGITNTNFESKIYQHLQDNLKGCLKSSLKGFPSGIRKKQSNGFFGLAVC